ncbi:hypothetical protein E9993_17100 [Labilibacter sediminis]|nr:hypothetical protein E9993_17100 [Labilibacter sediminis]
MKKAYYIVALVILMSVGLIYYFSQSKNTAEDQFDVALSADVQLDQIKLNNLTDTLNFTLLNNDWYLENHVQVSSGKINQMFDILKSLVVINPLTGPKGGELKKSIAKKGVEVTAYVKGRKVYRLLLMSDFEDLTGNIAFREGHQYVVKVSVPGAQGALQDKIPMDRQYWQGKSLFSLPMDQINKVKIDWGEGNESFEIINKEELQFIVNGEDRTKQSNLHTLNYYLYEFGNVELQEKNKAFEEKKGSLMCILSLETARGVREVEFYKILNDKGEEDKKYMVVYIPKANVWGSVKYLTMSPILKKASFFQKKTE